MELADQQNSDNGLVSGAEIPASAPTGGNAGDDALERGATSSPAKSEKLSLRQQIERNVESVRTEEAKRARAADGKFTKLDGAADVPATSEKDPKPEANAQPTASTPVGPPSAWKGIWENLSPEAQALAVKREADVEKGFAEYRTKTAQLSEISQVLEPLRPVLQQSGITSDAQAVKRLIEWEGSFRNPATRANAFMQLAQTYGVDLSNLVQSSSAAPSAAQDIPEPLRPVIDQFGTIQQTVQDVAQRVQSFEQQQINAQLTAFAKDHPHFEAVKVKMGQLMQAGIATDLDSAYQQAIAITPEISDQIRAEAERKKAEELAAANAEKARKAALAAVSPGGRPPVGAPAGGAQPVKKGMSARDSILTAVQELRGGQRA
jgi:hypothetical protein